MPAKIVGSEPGWRPVARADLARIATDAGVPVEVVEKDYALSYLLAGLMDVPALRDLRFKGGTALRKVYFGNYRFSEDLDFSAINAPRGTDLDVAMAAAVVAAETRLRERGRFRLEFDRPPERQPHPTGQDAFRIRVAFPWQSAPMVRLKVEITHDELLLLPASRRPVLHDYSRLGELLGDVRVATYALEEIVAEKLRALRQTELRLTGRGWSRPRVRDYYDLWRLLTDGPEAIDRALIRNILPAKLAHRGVTYRTVDDFFTARLVGEARKHWRANLGTFVQTLPDLEVVLSALRPLVEELLDEP